MYLLDLEIDKYFAIGARECIQKYANCSIYNKKSENCIQQCDTSVILSWFSYF